MPSFSKLIVSYAINKVTLWCYDKLTARLNWKKTSGFFEVHEY